MTTEPTLAKVQLTDGLGRADEVQPLVDRLEEGGCGEYCDSLGREASAALQSLQESYGQLLAENVRLRGEAAFLRATMEGATYQLSKARIWGGMDWHYNPLHPMHYKPALDRLREVLDKA